MAAIVAILVTAIVAILSYHYCSYSYTQTDQNTEYLSTLVGSQWKLLFHRFYK